MSDYEGKNLGYFQFYPADFLSSTMHLPNEALGAYIKILCFLWKKKKARETELKAVGYGSVNLNETEWLSIKELLVNDGEFFWSKRMEFEREKAMNNYIIKVENGKKGGRPKKNNLNETEQKPIGYDSVNLNETDRVTNQNQNHINSSYEELNKEVSANLTTENVEPKKIQPPPSRTGLFSIPEFEDVLAHANLHTYKFHKMDVRKWFDHWEALGWVDSNNKAIHWKNKIGNQSADERFFKDSENKRFVTNGAKKSIGELNREVSMALYEKLKAQEA